MFFDKGLYTYELSQKVERGAKALDKINADWFKFIDLNKLNMGSQTYCLLGQLYGTMRAGELNFVAVDNYLSIDHGFDIENPDTGEIAFERQIGLFHLLNYLWTEEILYRLNNVDVELENKMNTMTPGQKAAATRAKNKNLKGKQNMSLPNTPGYTVEFLAATLAAIKKAKAKAKNKKGLVNNMGAVLNYKDGGMIITKAYKKFYASAAAKKAWKTRRRNMKSK